MARQVWKHQCRHTVSQFTIQEYYMINTYIGNTSRSIPRNRINIKYLLHSISFNESIFLLGVWGGQDKRAILNAGIASIRADRKEYT
nr:hypothetical protein CFP56_36802 [Quercus suber]